MSTSTDGLELTKTNMSDRQQKYRETYRSRISGWYNGWVHVLVIYTIGFTALAIYISSMNNITWAEWLAVPLTFLMCNFFEWWLHRHIMHKLVITALQKC